MCSKSDRWSRTHERMRNVIDWLEHRTGLETAIKNFLYEDIPASSGWHQIIGSMAVFFFVIQVFTGGLLAFNFAATPGDAYNSVQYIMTELTGGPLIRGLHHWGASMMLIIVVLHMIQVFIYGAYKKPREATWMVGVVLLAHHAGLRTHRLSAAVGQPRVLGHRGHHANHGSAPVAGTVSDCACSAARRRRRAVSRSRDSTRCTRFFLPPLVIILIGIHIYLVRKHGVAPAVGDTAPRKKFFPNRCLRTRSASPLRSSFCLRMAVVADAPLGRLADPTDTAFTPRPEWYFLFLFQTHQVLQRPAGSGGRRGSAGRRGADIVPGSVYRSRADGAAGQTRASLSRIVVLSALAWTGLPRPLS